jgi:hypothetical protein
MTLMASSAVPASPTNRTLRSFDRRHTSPARTSRRGSTRTTPTGVCSTAMLPSPLDFDAGPTLGHALRPSAGTEGEVRRLPVPNRPRDEAGPPGADRVTFPVGRLPYEISKRHTHPVNSSSEPFLLVMLEKASVRLFAAFT